jgi:hypothetical protein
MAYIIVGQRKLGIEFMIAMCSYFGTFFMGHFVTLRPGIESIVFYVVGVYNILMYLAITLSDPGWLDEKQKGRINKLVSFCTHTFISSVITISFLSRSP